MTEVTSPGPELRSPGQLAALMGIPFSDQQLEAITAPLEPGVIVAGAGSGKTTVMAARVVWLVGTGTVAADQILGLTFTNKAASELGQRVRKALADTGLLRRTTAVPDGGTGEPAEPEIAEPTVLTYHAYASRLLTEHGLRIGHEPDTTVIADATRFQLAARVLREHTDPVAYLTTWLPTNVNYLLQLDAQLAEHLVSSDDVRRFHAREIEHWQAIARPTNETKKVVTAMQQRDELLDLVDEYRALKKRLGVMDFSDQMALGAQLAEQRPEVGQAERDTFRVVLLDEYQDTSVAQARLLRGLFSGDDTDAGRGHPVTAVGDPCQAIYGWRGASVSNIEGFGDDFPRADDQDVRRFPLSVNRRSDARILQTANALAGPLYSIHLGSRPLEPAGSLEAGIVRAASLPTYDDELAFLATEVPRAYEAMPVPTWSNIGVLVRDNKTAGAVHDALTQAGVPVEVVGLSGLLRMPEVVEVVSTLKVIHDVTANASLLALLTGPRWAIGPRDLALLGDRARWLARVPDPAVDDVAGKLEEAVEYTDPADIVSLVEALEDSGTADYSEDARERFKTLGRELRTLRRYVGEPLLDLVRRVIDVTGLDVELASSTSAVAQARRDNVSTFLDAVSSFAGIDGDASLPGLLAYLAAEEEYGQGLALAVPSEANSVKLLTVHRAKGLEWDVVFLPGVCTKVFPSGQGRARWPSSPSQLPAPLRGDYADLPRIREVSSKGLRDYVESSKAYELQEERRLGYVAVTRPRHELVVSCHWWGPEQKTPRGPSEFFLEISESMTDWGAEPELVAPPPADDDDNPHNRAEARISWPVEAGGDEVARRTQAAELVAAASVDPAAARDAADDQLMLHDMARVQQWDVELDRLVAEARASRADEIVVTLPPSLSATAVLRLQDDPRGLARDLSRPMPRKPSASARFGTRFHAWVEEHVGRQEELLEPDDLPGRGDHDIEGDEELRELTEAFAAGPFGSRTPHQIEAPFALVLGSQVVRGRIDAVYDTDDGGYLVVDWKTNRKQDADPLQLALYRLAWSELTGVPAERVQTAFYYVRSGEVVEHTDLPDRAALEQLVGSPER
jgi:DNA helicase-2/ATP-dependent DNA helicase PcrA